MTQAAPIRQVGNQSYHATIQGDPQSMPSLKQRLINRRNGVQAARDLEQPLYCVANLAGDTYCDATGRVAKGTKVNFFSHPKGASNVLGWPELTGALTNFTGQSGIMAQDQEYVATHVGVEVGEDIPLHILQMLLGRHCSLAQILNDSTSWEMGRPRDWPCGVFGPRTDAVAATGAASGPLTVTQFGSNGSVPPRRLSPGNEIFLDRQQRVSFVLSIDRDIYLTTDGAPYVDGENERLTEVAVGLWMFGLKSEGIRG